MRLLFITAMLIVLASCSGNGKDESTTDVGVDTAVDVSGDAREDLSEDNGNVDDTMETSADALDNEVEDSETADTTPDPTALIFQLLGPFGEENPEIVEALAGIPELADGLNKDEQQRVVEVAEVWMALTTREWDKVRPWFADRPALPKIDDSGMTTDGSLEDWSDDVLVAPDRPDDAGTGAVDLLESRFLLGEDSLWVSGKLANGCSEDAGFMVMIDHDRGLHYDTEISGYYFQGYKNTLARYMVDEVAAQSLDYQAIEWECEGDSFEVRIPWSILDEYELKPESMIWFFTFDMAGTLEEPLFDISPAVTFRPAQYQGAAEDLYRLVEVTEACSKDPKTAVGVALQNRFWRSVVHPDVVPTVIADGAEWVEYAADLPNWQAMYPVPYDFNSLPLEGRMLWASRIQQSLVFGSFAIYELFELLDPEQYEFVSVSIDDLKWYRQRLLEFLPIPEDLHEFIGDVDTWMWHSMRYCGQPDIMDEWCETGALSDVACLLWEQDKAEENFTLGTVVDVEIPNHEGVSASYQRKFFEEHGYFKGDCRTHCLLTNTYYRSVGIAATGWQYYPDDEDVWRAVHELPLYFNPETGRWRSFQIPDHIEPKSALAHIWYFLPVRDPLSFPRYHVDFDKVSTFQAFQTFFGITFGQMMDTIGVGITHDFWEQAFWKTYPDTAMEW